MSLLSRKVLYALVLILIVSFSIAGYEFYVIQVQDAKIREQTASIQEQKKSIEGQRVIIYGMNETIISLNGQNYEMRLAVEKKDQIIRDFERQVEDLSNALNNSTQWPDLEALKAFLGDDRTDEHPYVKGSYECEEFALDLQKAAYKKGYFLSIQYVTVGLLERYGWEYQAPRTMTHVCNLAFVIKQNAFYIIEPQTDEIAFLAYAD